MIEDGIWLAYRRHLGRNLIHFVLIDKKLIGFSIHIAVTQLHTQDGVVDRLLEDTRQCVADILASDNKNDTPTVDEFFIC